MNAEHPASAELLQELVHPRDHLLLAAHCVQTVVRVPHVADDDCRLLRRPGLPLLDDVKLAPLFSARSQSEGELGSVSEGEGGEKKNGEAGEAHGGPSANGGVRLKTAPLCRRAVSMARPHHGSQNGPGGTRTSDGIVEKTSESRTLPTTDGAESGALLDDSPSPAL